MRTTRRRKEEEASAHGSHHHAQRSSHPPRLLRILVVEDDNDVREMMVETLGITGPHAITVAKDGDEGLHRLRDDDFDLIVTDVGLPKLSGLEMLDQAQREGLLGDTPIVVSSAQSDLRSAAHLRGACWMRKPVDIDKLCALVHVVRARVTTVERGPPNDSAVELAPAPAPARRR